MSWLRKKGGWRNWTATICRSSKASSSTRFRHTTLVKWRRTPICFPNILKMYVCIKAPSLPLCPMAMPLCSIHFVRLCAVFKGVNQKVRRLGTNSVRWRIIRKANTWPKITQTSVLQRIYDKPCPYERACRRSSCILAFGYAWFVPLSKRAVVYCTKRLSLWDIQLSYWIRMLRQGHSVVTSTFWKDLPPGSCSQTLSILYCFGDFDIDRHYLPFWLTDPFFFWTEHPNCRSRTTSYCCNLQGNDIYKLLV